MKAPQNAQHIAQKLNLRLLAPINIAQGNAIPELGASDPQTDAAIQALKQGEVSQVLQSGNKLAVAVVTAPFILRIPPSFLKRKTRFAWPISSSRPFSLPPKSRRRLPTS